MNEAGSVAKPFTAAAALMLAAAGGNREKQGDLSAPLLHLALS